MGRWDGPALDAWRAWRPRQAAALLSGVRAPWCVVGGWSIDLFLGEETREHSDLEIAVARHDFPEVRAALAGFVMHTVSNGTVRRLGPDEDPPEDHHQNWVLDAQAGAWRMDVMLEPGDAATWVFRRDERIRADRSFMVGSTADGVPFLQPQGALLFKAKSANAKDEADFARCLPRMDAAARSWLHGALNRVHPGHPWRGRLEV